MNASPIRILANLLLLGGLLATQACAPAGESGANVANAYQTSDAVAIQPYTRSIFSSNNF